MTANQKSFVSAVLGRELLQRAARALHGRGIEVMPLKGVLLHVWVYADDPSQRVITDVDVLVRPSRFAEAQQALEAAGFRSGGRSPQRNEVTLLLEPYTLALDLHRQLFAPLRYRLPADGLFARATDGAAHFDAPVRLPSVLDTAAHLIGHAVNDHVDARSTPAFEDLARLLGSFQVEPAALANHLAAHGLARAARLLFVLSRGTPLEPYARRCEPCLPLDPAGRLMARAGGAGIAALPPRARAGALAAHLANATLPQALLGAAYGALRRPVVR